LPGRRHIPENIRRQLMIEAGFSCCIPSCKHETGLDLHHIDGDNSNNQAENLIVLCAVHHRLATEGKIDAAACRMVKSMLRQLKNSHQGSPQDLNSRLEFMQTAIQLLGESNKFLRMTSVGPLFLHPIWYMKRRNANVQLPNMEKSLYSFVKKYASERTHEIRLILRNASIRYREKVDRFVSATERTRFIDDLLATTFDLWGQSGERGPDLCCVDTGFMQVELIFKGGVIVSHRAGAESPITGGRLYRDSDEIENQRQRFDTVFDGCSRGQMTEVSSLRTFIEKIW
jgi:hypothetical protein